MNCIGMPWYTAASWARLRAVADDRDTLPVGLSEYEQKATRLIGGYEAQGITVEKIMLDIDDLVRWCRSNGFRIDQRGRAAYGATLVASVGQPEGRA